MQEDDFLDTVTRGVDGESTAEAREATLATLRTLSEALTGGQAADLATYLSPKFAGALTESEPGEAASYSVEGFLERVGDRGGIDDPETAVRAVLSVLSEAASDRELENARKQLPDEFGPLFSADG